MGVFRVVIVWIIINRNVIIGCWILFFRFYDILDFVNVIFMRKRRVRFFYFIEIFLVFDLGFCIVVFLRFGVFFRRVEVIG